MKKIMTYVVLLMIMVLPACKDKAPEKENHSYKSVRVKLKEDSTTLYFSGVIEPINEIAATTPVDAVIKEKHFKYGQAVKKGDVLVVLDSSQLQKDYDESLTSYLKAKDSLDTAKAKFAGTKALWKDGLVAKNSYTSDESALNNTIVSFLQAKIRLSEMLSRAGRNDLDKLSSLRLSQTQKVKSALNQKYNTISIKADSDGIALTPPKNADKDSVLQVGSQVKQGQVLTLIGDLSGVSLHIKIPEVDIDKIKPGLKARIKGVAFPNMHLQGVVSSVNAQASSASGGDSLPLFFGKVDVPTLTPAQKAKIKVGMSASIEVDTHKKKELTVPIAAIYQKKGKTFIDVRKTNGSITAREITTGRTQFKDVVVLSGIEAGDSIVWRNNHGRA